MDARRLHLRSLAVVAYAAYGQGAPAELGAWLRERIDQAALELIEEDREAEHDGALCEHSNTEYRSLCRALGVVPGLGRRLSVAFHGLPYLQRKLIRAALQRSSSRSEIARALGRTEPEVESSLRTALECLQKSAGARVDARMVASIRIPAAESSAERDSAAAVGAGPSAHLEHEARKELADLLRQHCRSRLIDGEDSSAYFSRYRGLNDRVCSVSQNVLRHRLGELDAAFPAVVWTATEREVRAVLSDAETSEPSVVYLARIGHGMSPGNDWLIMAAMANIVEGRKGEAEELTHRALEACPSEEVQLRCFELLTVSAIERRELDQAICFQERARSMRSDYPLGEMNRLTLALLTGRESEALSASTRLHELVGSSHEMVDAMVFGHTVRKRLGHWYSTPVARDLGKRLKKRLRPAARRIAETL